MEDALDRLRNGPHDVAVAVHETRKDLKKMRSLLRLSRGGLPPKQYRRENARYRDAARLLSSTRDADVKLRTLAALRERYGDDVPSARGLQLLLQEEVERLASSNGNGLAAAMQEAAAAIEEGGASVDALRIEKRGWKLLEPGLVASYRRGKAGLDAVSDQVSDEAVHEWRKGVKDLWYHLRLLRDTWPEGLSGPIDQADTLSELLGDHHDLSVLAIVVREQEEEARRLLALLERRQGELLVEAMPIGQRLYAENPQRYARRLRVYWKVWRKQKR